MSREQLFDLHGHWAPRVSILIHALVLILPFISAGLHGMLADVFSWMVTIHAHNIRVREVRNCD